MNEIIVLDIETTGVSAKWDKIVEIGIVKLDLDTGNISPIMDYIVHEKGITEEKLANSWIINHSDLTIEQVKYSINIEAVLPKVQLLANTYPVTAFNRKFDIGFLEERGIKFPNLYPCPMIELTPIMAIKTSKGNKWPNVNEAYRYFFPDASYNEKHRGFDDALHEAQIIYELHKLKNSNQLEAEFKQE